jgi:hypothetical protein
MTDVTVTFSDAAHAQKTVPFAAKHEGRTTSAVGGPPAPSPAQLVEEQLTG